MSISIVRGILYEDVGRQHVDALLCFPQCCFVIDVNGNTL